MIFKRKKTYGSDIYFTTKQTIIKFQDEYSLASQNEKNMVAGSHVDSRIVRSQTKLAQAKYAFLLRAVKDYFNEK